MARRYGLPQLRDDAKDPALAEHWSLFKKVLQRAGVRVTVVDDIKRSVARNEDEVRVALDGKASVHNADLADETKTKAEIKALQDARQTRANGNQATLGDLDAREKRMRQEIAELNELAGKFS